jgi:hypothetical protein
MRKGRSKESFWARGDRAHNFRLQPAVARVRSLRRLNRPLASTEALGR